MLSHSLSALSLTIPVLHVAVGFKSTAIDMTWAYIQPSQKLVTIVAGETLRLPSIETEWGFFMEFHIQAVWHVFDSFYLFLAAPEFLYIHDVYVLIRIYIHTRTIFIFSSELF